MPETFYLSQAGTPVYRSANSAARTNNTLADDDVMTFPVLANTKWQVEGVFVFGAANATMDIKLGLNLPSGATAYWGYVGNRSSQLNYSWGADITTGGGAIGTEGLAITQGGANGNTGAHFLATVMIGATAGTVAIQWAQATTDAGNLIMLAGSYLIYRQIA